MQHGERADPHREQQARLGVEGPAGDSEQVFSLHISEWRDFAGKGTSVPSAT